MTSPIAVVGMACRLPDDVSSPEELWKVILEKRDTCSEPVDRWNPGGFHDPGGSKAHSTASRKAHYMTRDVMAFDAAFFNINAVEALSMTPEQRIVMEVTYEALESAGLTLDDVADSRTGCYIGTGGTEYRPIIDMDTEIAPRYSAIGLAHEMPANRVSWFYNLKGPSLTLSTACSSSITAIHTACQGLILGETDMAVAGGVNMILNPTMLVYLNMMGMTSPEGHCKSFDASADGYSRGEGCGIVILKRLDDAIRDNDPIRAVIRGTGVNSDGYTQGFTMPSAEFQAALIREVYRKADLDMADTQLVECHGTGTKVGDPIETKAIYETLGRKKSHAQPLVIGSVKPNIGHLEAASGVASLIKSILALEKGQIPPQAFFTTPNPSIPLSEWNLKVPTTLMPWPSTKGGRRRVSINNFGVGGTNTHAILESAPPRGIQAPAAKKKRLFVLSSQDRNGMVRVAQSLAGYLGKHAAAAAGSSAAHEASLAYTLGSKRSRLPWKTFCVASGSTDLRSGLLAVTGDEAIRSSATGRIGFVFTGQGAQWPKMGLRLLEFDVFRRTLEKCQEYLNELGCSWDAAEELGKPTETSLVTRPEMSQPLCTILQLGIVDLLDSWNISPTRVVGHSSGEIAAAYCAGFITAREAVEVAYRRGELSAALTSGTHKENAEGGGMLAVGCSREKAERLIAEVTTGYLTVACVNSPSNVTISGDVAAIEELHNMLKKTSMFVARLKVEVAYHSEHMQAIYPDYVRSISHIRPSGTGREHVTMVSSVVAAELDAQAVNGFYWGRNLVSPVLFSDALAELVKPADGGPASSVDLLVEIGPHGALKSSVQEILADKNVKDVAYMSSLSRGKDDQASLLSLAGNLFTFGAAIDISRVNNDGEPVPLLTDLPPYPWQHSKRFDADTRIHREYAMRPYPASNLLGAPMPSVGPKEHVWRGYLRVDEERWASDHKLSGMVLYPAAGFVAMALEGARRLADAGRKIRVLKLRDVVFGRVAIVGQETPTEFVLHIRPPMLGGNSAAASGTTGWLEFRISSSEGPDIALRENCHGLVRIEYYAGTDTDHTYEQEATDREEKAIFASSLAAYEAAVAACQYKLPVDDFYRDAAEAGFQFGPSFKNLTDIHFRPGETVFEMHIANPGNTPGTGQPGNRPHLIHPTTLDTILQTPIAASYRGRRLPVSELMIPTSIQELEVSPDLPFDAGTPLKGFTTFKPHRRDELHTTMDVFDEGLSQPYVRIRGYRCMIQEGVAINTTTSDGNASDTKPGLCYSTRWKTSFNLLHTESELTRAVASAGQTANDKLVEIASMILHESPNTTVLEVLTAKDGSGTIMSRVVPSCRPQQTKYGALAGSPIPAVVDGEVLDLKFGEAVAPEARFDLVILGQDYRESPDVQNGLHHLFDHVKQGGRLICGFDYDQLGGPAPKSSQARVLGRGSDSSVTIFSAPTLASEQHVPDADDGDAASVMEKVLVLQPPAPTAAVQSLSNELVDILQSQGLQADTVTWTELASAVSANHVVVSLLELDKPFMENLSSSDYRLVQDLIIKSTTLLSPSGFIIDGAMRVARRELGNYKLKILHLSSLKHGASLAAKVLASAQPETEFLEDGNGLLQVGRDRQLNTEIASYAGTGTHMDCGFPVTLDVSKPGVADSLHFRPREKQPQLGENEVEISIKASGVNCRNVVISLGLTVGFQPGYEGAGVVLRTGSRVTSVKSGDRVSAHILGSSHTTVARTLDVMCAKMPDNMSFDEGAALPVAFTIAYHALVDVARLRPKQSVLIHAAAGGVGQAAIQIARHLDLTLYVTVGSDDKKAHVMKEYGLLEDHVFDSRGESFALGVQRITGGRGVDCVLNSLSGELLRQSLSCLAPLGTFVDLGSHDISENTSLGMSPPVTSGTTFSRLNLDLLFNNPDLMAETWRKAFDLIRNGVAHAPTPLVVNPIHKVQDALRLVQSGKHYGKVVLSFEQDGQVPVMRGPEAGAALQLDSSGTYLLVGGLGGLGRSLAQMLVDCGARNIAFISRSGAVSPSAKAVVESLSSRPGVSVKAYAADATNKKSLDAALESCRSELPAIKGVVQMAMVLRDAVFENMSFDQWTGATGPKIEGTRNLHECFGPAHHPLDFFIMCSSLSGVIGNRGQANYAAGNTYQDALAFHRRSHGLRACAVDLGIMRDVGVLAETGTAGDLTGWEELLGIRETTFHALMKTIINKEQQQRLDGNQALSSPAQVTVGLATARVFQAAGLNLPDWLTEDARFGHLSAIRYDTDTAADKDNTDVAKETIASLPAKLATCKTLDEALDAMVGGLIERVAGIVSIPVSEVDSNRPMYKYGVDSLVAMEIRNWIQRDIKADISLFDVLEAVPLTKFAEKVVSRTKLCKI
ncbi:LOW QUALITY PROTEIN: beta-ketoacyl synthase domain-containing protein [Colletotrichum navitas]|uniref:Beta-ketoacyl synthase domain-containing protein n=1 Tax=Colletotrichum navitas TaxID=681940 RepID=A0AAD8PIT9_9PEZI|nr:LOW QUALITY PROTEIN: beta-ketoacyl synthase domain-containing protein [Colletotrichum navitas]KAK1561623.1 LOW QUALITY PROTEIN: beta-ketoacyl synthase domain-containing protein [Colletotrichum navitas]